jgi:hypothetical protein
MTVLANTVRARAKAAEQVAQTAQGTAAAAKDTAVGAAAAVKDTVSGGH